AGSDALVIQAVPGQVADLEVLDDHVRLLGEAADGPGSLLVLEVDGQAPLAAVDGEVVTRLSAHVRRAPAPGVVTRWGLHLDHVGSHVGQQLCAVGAGENPAQVQDPHVLEHPVSLAPWPCATFAPDQPREETHAYRTSVVRR